MALPRVTPDGAVFAMVIVPAPFVTDIFVPAVIVVFARVFPVAFPTKISPFTYEPCPVPPSASVMPEMDPPVMETELDA